MIDGGNVKCVSFVVVLRLRMEKGARGERLLRIRRPPLLKCIHFTFYCLLPLLLTTCIICSKIIQQRTLID